MSDQPAGPLGRRMKRKALLFSAYLLGSLSYSLRSAARSCVRAANQVPDHVPTSWTLEAARYYREQR